MNLAEIVVKHGIDLPEHIALIHKDRRITYRALDEMTNRLGNSLVSLGIGYGEKVALLCPNIPEFPISFFSVLKTGATIIPVNFLFKGEELKFVLHHSQASSVILAAPFLPELLSIRDELPCLKRIIVFGIENREGLISYEELMKNGENKSLLYDTDDDDTAAILYTSGTTGRLKGAMLTHYNIYFDTKAISDITHRTPDDCFLLVIPLFHSFGMTGCMMLGMLSGAKLVMMEKFIPQQTLQSIEEHRVTVFMAVPSIYGALMLHGRNINREKLSSLEICVTGGAPMPEVLHKNVEDYFGCIMAEGYGPTECSPVVSLNPINVERKIGSVGPPIPGTEVKIADEENNEVPDGAIGEILVKGPNVMKGYLFDPHATEETVSDGWLHTGDLGKRDKDGYLYIVDRKKDLIITGGMNVYPREIEELLIQHPSIQEVAVTGKFDYLRGEVPQAFVVLKEGCLVTEKELMSYCREHLAKFKVPKEITFMEILPKNYTGKVLKRVLREEDTEKCSACV